MNFHHCIIALLATSATLCGAHQAQAVPHIETYQQTIADPVPPISNALAAYIEGIYNEEPPRTGVTDAPIVGIDGTPLSADLTGQPNLRYTPGPGVADQIVGNGIDELVAFSFNIPQIIGKTIVSADLHLALIPRSGAITTDLLFFADNNSTGDENYGNAVFADLGVGEPVLLDFDLSAMPREGGTENLLGLLTDGTLDVLYGDDSHVLGAILSVGILVPEPAPLAMFGTGLLALGWQARRRLRKTN